MIAPTPGRANAEVAVRPPLRLPPHPRRGSRPARIAITDPAADPAAGPPSGPLAPHVGRHRSQLRAAVRAIAAGKGGEG
jgi:hypothetical protein